MCLACVLPYGVDNKAELNCQFSQLLSVEWGGDILSFSLGSKMSYLVFCELTSPAPTKAGWFLLMYWNSDTILFQQGAVKNRQT